MGASGTTACLNVTELQYGDVQGRADERQGSVAPVTREEGEEVTITDVRTSEAGEHERITSTQVSRIKNCGPFRTVILICDFGRKGELCCYGLLILRLLIYSGPV